MRFGLKVNMRKAAITIINGVNKGITLPFRTRPAQKIGRTFLAHPKAHRIAFSFGALSTLLVVLFALVIATKSQRVNAGGQTILQIELPAASALSTDPIALPALAGLGSMMPSMPEAEILERPLVSIALRDGIPVGPSVNVGDLAVGLFKRGSVQLTKDQAEFTRRLSDYLSANNAGALITSGVRTSSGQLDIIKQRISERGMLRSFPGLSSARLQDTNVWSNAWEWLKSRHIPVNAPTDYINGGGEKVSGSLHLHGLAIDLVANDLDGLKEALTNFANTSKSKRGALRIAAIVREPTCVHLSLTK